MPTLTIAGYILNREYQEAKLIAEDIAESQSNQLKVVCKGMLEDEWQQYLRELKARSGGRLLSHAASSPLLVHSVFGYVGNVDALVQFATKHYNYVDQRGCEEYSELYKEMEYLSAKEFASYIETSPNTFMFIDLKITKKNQAAGSAAAANPSSKSFNLIGGGSGSDSHRMIVELYSRSCPMTVDNFLSLARGVTLNGGSTRYSYINTRIHRVVRDGWLQGGDVVNNDGSSGHSSFDNKRTFEDENLSFTHHQRGVLSMVNNGPHSNHSQFFITQKALPSFDRKYVVFGRVIGGFHVLDALNDLVTVNQCPADDVRIVAAEQITVDMLLNTEFHSWTRKKQQKENAKQKAQQQAHTKQLMSDGMLTPRSQPKNMTLLVVGLQGSGKTTLVNHLLGRNDEITKPTNGFEQNSLEFHNIYNLKLWCLGGASNIRGYWENYYDAIHGVVYVVDGSHVANDDYWTAEQQVFHTLYNHELIRDKPILVFVNKQDVSNALSASEVALRLQLPDTPNINIIKCTAYQPSPNNNNSDSEGGANDEVDDFAPAPIQATIERGIEWLCHFVERDYVKNNERVIKNIAERKIKEKEKMQAIRERIAREKEEREKNGIPEPQ